MKTIQLGLYGALIGLLFSLGIWVVVSYLPKERLDTLEYRARRMNIPDSYNEIQSRKKGTPQMLYKNITLSILKRAFKEEQFKTASRVFNNIEDRDVKWVILSDLTVDGSFQELYYQGVDNTNPITNTKLINGFMNWLEFYMPEEPKLFRIVILLRIGSLKDKYSIGGGSDSTYAKIIKEHLAISNTEQNNAYRSIEEDLLNFGFAGLPAINLSEYGSRAEEKEEMSGSSGFLIIPILFSAIGFVLSVLSKPILEHISKGVIVPAISRALAEKKNEE